MRFERAYECCILFVLNQAPYAYGSPSSPAHGDGLFGSPISPSLHSNAMLDTNHVTASPALVASIAAEFATPQKARQNSPAGSPTVAFQPISPQSHTSYTRASADVGSPGAKNYQTTPQVPSTEAPAADQLAAAPRPSFLQDTYILPQFTSPVPATGASPTLLRSDSQEVYSPSHLGDLPQLKKSGPWLFSATREKLLGAVNFMKLTEELGTYPSAYQPGVNASASPNSRGSRSRHSLHFQTETPPRPDHAAAARIPGAATTVNVDDKQSAVQTYAHIPKSIEARTSAPGGARLEEVLIDPRGARSPTIGPPLPRVAFGGPALNYYSTYGQRPVLPHGLPQLQDEQLEAHERQPQQSQQLLQEKLQAHNLLHSQVPVYVQEVQVQYRDLKPQHAQERQNPQERQQSHVKQQTQLSQPHQLQDQPGPPWLASPIADALDDPQALSGRTGYDLSSAIDAPTRYNVYVSEKGESLVASASINEDSLSSTRAPMPVTSVSTFAGSAYSYAKNLVAPTVEGILTEAPPRPQHIKDGDANDGFLPGDGTTKSHLVSQKLHTETRKENLALLDEGPTKADYASSNFEKKASDEETAVNDSYTDCQEKSFAPEAYTLEQHPIRTDGVTLSKDDPLAEQSPAGAQAKGADVTEFGSAETNYLSNGLAMNTPKGETRISGAKEEKTKAVLDHSPELKQSVVKEAQSAEAGKALDETSKHVGANASMQIQGLITDTMDSEAQSKQKNVPSRGDLQQEGAEPLLDKNSTAVLQPNKGQTLHRRDVVDGTGKQVTAKEALPSTEPESVYLPTQSAGATGEKTFFVDRELPSIEAAADVELPATQVPGSITPEAAESTPENGVAAVPAGNTVPKAPSQLMQSDPRLAVSASTIQNRMVHGGLIDESARQTSAQTLPVGTANVVAAFTHDPKFLQQYARNSISTTLTSVDMVTNEAANVGTGSAIMGKMANFDRAGVGLPPRPPIRSDSRPGLPHTDPGKDLLAESMFITQRVTLPTTSPLPFKDYRSKKTPLSPPAEFIRPAPTAKILQPLPLKPGGILPVGPAFPFEKFYVPYPVGTTFVAPQPLYTSVPAPSIQILPTGRPIYVGPPLKTEPIGTPPPAPVYIGQSIRQDTRNSPPSVYPLGARLYEQMIPRAELFLASSSYAEEYLDLIAALYCLFHKWPCNNMQEFAEETRKRQEQVERPMPRESGS